MKKNIESLGTNESISKNDKENDHSVKGVVTQVIFLLYTLYIIRVDSVDIWRKMNYAWQKVFHLHTQSIPAHVNRVVKNKNKTVFSLAVEVLFWCDGQL